MATPERTVRFYEAQGLAFRAACSPDGAAHAAYGLTRLRWSDLLAPRVLVRGIGAFLRGSRPGRMDGDVLLRPGTFVVDAAGLVIFARRGRDPADRPSLSELLSALDA